MKELLQFIIENALPEGTEFTIDRVEDEQGVRLDLHVPEEYRGIIIGRSGANIKAIRNVLNIMAKRENQRVFVKVVD